VPRDEARLSVADGEAFAIVFLTFFSAGDGTQELEKNRSAVSNERKPPWKTWRAHHLSYIGSDTGRADAKDIDHPPSFDTANVRP
jgi:hypothetical protein